MAPRRRVGGVRQNLPLPRSAPAASASAPVRRASSAASSVGARSGGGGRSSLDGTRERLTPWAVDLSDSRGLGNHMVRFDPVRKDHRLYTSPPTDRRIDRRRGELYGIGEKAGSSSVELGGAPPGIEMRQASFDYGANKLLRRKSLEPQPYRDGLPSAGAPPPEPKRCKPKPAWVDKNRSAIKIMALPFTEGMDPYDTERWNEEPGHWDRTLKRASWADRQPHLKVPKRWLTTTNSLHAGWNDPSKTGEASFR